MADDFAKIRSAIKELAALQEAEWQELEGLCTIKQVAKGDCLTRIGQVENHIYFLNSGATRNYFIKDGKEFTLDFLFAGDFVTAYQSLITRKPSAVAIELLAPAEVISISYSSLQQLYSRHAQGERIGRLIAEMQYVKRLEKEMDLLSLTAEERYGNLVKQAPDLVSNISVKHLSSYLGIAPESLSRIRKLYAKT